MQILCAKRAMLSIVAAAVDVVVAAVAVLLIDTTTNGISWLSRWLTTAKSG